VSACIDQSLMADAARIAASISRKASVGAHAARKPNHRAADKGADAHREQKIGKHGLRAVVAGEPVPLWQGRTRDHFLECSWCLAVCNSLRAVLTACRCALMPIISSGSIVRQRAERSQGDTQ
jgi:hypothetical protein